MTEEERLKEENARLKTILSSVTVRYDALSEKLMAMDQAPVLCDDTDSVSADTDEVNVIMRSPLFDAEWYSRQYNIGSMNAALHYLTLGWKRYYDPSARFSTLQYLLHNKDVEQGMLCPLLHYEIYGKKERRAAYKSDLKIHSIYDAKTKRSKAAFAPESGQKEDVNALSERFSKYEAVSFDIFDTLILRNLSKPSDLFRIIGGQMDNCEFAGFRVNAEQKCLREIGSGANILDIYNEISRQLDIDVSKAIQLELDYEKKICIANPYIQLIFDELVRLGKQVYITCDSYWPKEYLEELLHSCGLDGWKDVFVSCDIGSSMNDGELQKRAWDVIGRDKKVIHVGDSADADIKPSEEIGWDTYHYRNPHDSAALFYDDECNKSIPLSIAEAIWKNTLHNGAGSYTMEYEHGFLYGGFLAVGYCDYINRYAKLHGDELILFAGEGMEIVSSVYEKHFGDIPFEYLDEDAVKEGLSERLQGGKKICLAELGCGCKIQDGENVDHLVLGASDCIETMDQITLGRMNAYAYSPLLNSDLMITGSDLKGRISAACLRAMFCTPRDERMKEIREGIMDFADLYMQTVKVLDTCYEISGRDVFDNFAHIAEDFDYLYMIFSSTKCEDDKGDEATVGELIERLIG